MSFVLLVAEFRFFLKRFVATALFASILLVQMLLGAVLVDFNASVLDKITVLMSTTIDTR